MGIHLRKILKSTPFGESLLDAADAAAARLGLGLGSAAVKNEGDFDAAGAADAVQGNIDDHANLTTSAHGGIVSSTDARLTDARTPTAHTHTAGDITGGTLDAGRIPNLAATYQARGERGQAGGYAAIDADGVVLSAAGFMADTGTRTLKLIPEGSGSWQLLSSGFLLLQASGISGFQFNKSSGTGGVYFYNGASVETARFTGGVLPHVFLAHGMSDSVVVVGGVSANASAKMQVDSTTRGFLPPRMTTAQRNSIASPAAGLVIYNTSTNKLNLRTASAWEEITST